MDCTAHPLNNWHQKNQLTPSKLMIMMMIINIIMNCHIILLDRPTNLFIFDIFDGNVSYYHSLSLCQRTVNCADYFCQLGKNDNSNLYYIIPFLPYLFYIFFKGDKK